MSVVFRGMSLSDVQLRLCGTWVRCGEEVLQPCLVLEINGEEDENDSGYYDSTISSVFGWVSDGGKAVIQVQEIQHTCPVLGYAVVSNTLVYVARLPERQSRSGLPPNSIRVQTSRDRWMLQDYNKQDAAELVQNVMHDRGAVGVLAALAENRSCILSPYLAAVPDKSGTGMTLFGPNFEALGTVRQGMRQDEVLVRTRNPVTVSAYLGDSSLGHE